MSDDTLAGGAVPAAADAAAGDSTAELHQRLDSTTAAVAITACTYLLVVIVALAYQQFDLSTFVVAGEQFVSAAEAPPGLNVRAGESGYDGQFVYRLALDPFSTARTEHGVTLDFPARRQQRITYPLLVWLVTGGHASWVPAGLIAVNYVGLCALAFIGSCFARMARLHALWGLMLPFYPGFVMTLRRDLSEIVTASFLLGGILLLRRGRYGWAALCLALALMARETAVIAVACILLVSLFQRWRRPERNDAWWPPAIALIAWAVFQLGLASVWHRIPVLSGGDNVGIPFAGFASYFLQWWRLDFLEMCYLVLFAGAALAAIRRSHSLSIESLAFLFYLAFAVSLNGFVWAEDWSFMRVIAEFYIFGWMVLLGSRAPTRISLAAGTFALWVEAVYLRCMN